MMKYLVLLLSLQATLYQSTWAQSDACSKIDLALLIDGSASVYREWYGANGGLFFARNFVDKFNVGDDGVRISIQEFADYGFMLYRFNDMQIKARITNEILPTLQIRHNYETRYEHAFQMAYRDMFRKGNGQRDHADDIAILITDGSYYPDMSYAVYEAGMLRRAGIKLYILAYGSVDRKFMLDMLNGDSSRLWLFQTHQDLSANLDRIYAEICPFTIFNQLPAQPAFARDIPPPPASQAIPASASTAPGCGELDLALLVDGSASVYREWFATDGVLQFTRDFVNRLDISKDKIHVSVQEFAEGAVLLHRFSNTQNKNMIANNVLPALQIRHEYGTRYEHAFQKAYLEQFEESNGARNSSSKVAIVITDGSYFPDASYARYEARRLAAAGIKLYIFAYGNVDRNFMLSMVNQDTTKVRLFPSPQALTSSVNSLAEMICPSVPNIIPIPALLQAAGSPIVQVPAAQACSSIDVCFLIDPTFRIMSNWHGPRGTRAFLNELMKKFTTDQPDVRTCAQFITSDPGDAGRLWRLFENPNKYFMDAKIRDGVPYLAPSIMGYSTSLTKVMSQQFIQMHGDRPSSKNVLVILASDYVQDDPTEAVMREVNSLRLREIKTYVVSWGRPNRVLLSELAGGDSNRMMVHDFDESPFDEVDMIYNDVCRML